MHQCGVIEQGVAGAMLRAGLRGYARRTAVVRAIVSGYAVTFAGVVERDRGLKCRESGVRGYRIDVRCVEGWPLCCRRLVTAVQWCREVLWCE